MVYDWESHKDLLNHLYVNEKTTIEEIITHMRIHHNFTPRYVTLYVLKAHPARNTAAWRHGNMGDLRLPAGLPRSVFSPAV